MCFTLDPLAEYLAAGQLVTRSRTNPEVLRDFVARVQELRAQQETVHGFLVAVRDCCSVRKVGADVLALLDGQIARAA